MSGRLWRPVPCGNLWRHVVASAACGTGVLAILERVCIPERGCPAACGGLRHGSGNLWPPVPACGGLRLPVAEETSPYWKESTSWSLGCPAACGSLWHGISWQMASISWGCSSIGCRIPPGVVIQSFSAH